MAKFLVTSGSYFDPFTYDELAKPIQQTVEAHNATQDAYETLMSETEALRQYIMREPENSEARMLYDSYTKKLENLQNNLWQRGYNAGTRRDLSIARAGYASDITRLGSAIKARQDRSNEYWKIKHEHPDMIMSSDPGAESLDKYLQNDRFGQDYYSYSGEQFMNEVGADAKARANEIMTNPKVLEKYPELAGYIPVLQKNGFSSVQVEAAAALVRGDRTLYDAISDPASKTAALILSNVLQSHLESTGASGRVDPKEYDRLIKYGKAGLSQAIGKDDIDFMKDNEYAYDQEIRAARAKAGIELDTYRQKKAIDVQAKAAEAAATAAQQYGATNTGETISMESPIYEEWIKATRNQAKHYRDGQTHTIASPRGDISKTAHNEYEMSTYLYETKARAQIRSGYGGYDIAFEPKKGDYRVRLKDGREMTVEISKMDEADARRLGLDPKSAVAVRNKNGKLLEPASSHISVAREEWLRHVDEYMEANPGIEKYAISPKEQKRLRERYEYPDTAPWEDFYPYMLTKASKGDESAVVIANDSSHDYQKKNLARAIIREYNSNSTEDHGKTSRFAFYEATDGNTGHKKEGITDIRKIFGTKNNGELRDDTLTNISATLQDLAAERPMIRIQTSVNPGKTFLIDADMLGSLFSNNYTSVVPETGMSNSQMIDYAMFPILHPDAVYSMSKQQADKWSRDCYELLDGDFPVVARPNGDEEPATPREIVRDKEFQEWLKHSVMEHIANPSAQKIRQVIGQGHEQTIGDQSANAAPIL